jgi:Ca2+-binding RTX toxin-like protein
LIDRDGTGARELTNDVDSNWSPAWQPLGPRPSGCTLWGTAADDLLVGGDGSDVVCGLGGDDTLIGLGGNDRLYGGDGNDELAGGLGHDVLSGGAGNDTLDARNGDRDGVAGGPGEDVAIVSGTTDRLTGIEHRRLDRDLATWQPTTADAWNTTNPPVRAVDGLVGDWWNSGHWPGAWMEVDLGRPVTLGRVALVTPDAPEGSTVFVLGRSDNTQPYRLLHTFRGPLADLEQVSFTPRKPWSRIRYVRVAIPAGSPWGWVSIRELELFPPAAQANK